MAEPFDVAVRVISQKGHCGTEHKVGDNWVIGSKTPAGICASAFNAIYPNVRVLRFGGTFPWATEDPDVTCVACPDPFNPVIFELRRVRK